MSPASSVLALVGLSSALLFVFLSPPITADDPGGGGNKTCNITHADPLILGFTQSNFIVIFNTANTLDSATPDSGCFCLFQVPSYSLYKGKAYLTGGKNLLEVWPELKGKLGNCFAVSGIVISDNTDSYVLFSNQNILFNIGTKKIASSCPKSPGAVISSRTKMTYYGYGEPEAITMEKYVYSGSSLTSVETSTLTGSYSICGPANEKDKNHPTHLVVSKGTVECPYRMWWTPSRTITVPVGFDDGKDFYILTPSYTVHIFEMDALQGPDDKLGEPKLGAIVPFTETSFGDFFVSSEPPEDAKGHADDNGPDGRGKKGSSAPIVVIILIILIILIIFIAVAVFCFCKHKKAKEGGGKGKRKGSKPGKMHRKASSSKKASSGQLKKKGRSSSRLGSKSRGKSSRRAGGIKRSNLSRNVRSKRSVGLSGKGSSRKASASKRRRSVSVRKV